MTLTASAIATELSSSLQLDMHVELTPNGSMMVHTPLHFADGDEYQIYLKQLPSGAIRISDFGHTMMQLSYDIDIGTLRSGSRAKKLTSILLDNDARMENGEVFIETTQERLADAVSRLSKTITGICAI